MSCDTLHLINTTQNGCHAIIKGASFGFSPLSDGIDIFIPNVNLSDWVPISQIKKESSDDALPIASFNFAIPVFETRVINTVSVSGTSLKMRLDVTNSGLLEILPLPFPIVNSLTSVAKLIASNEIIVGENCYTYDVKVIHPLGLEHGFEPIIEPSIVQVISGISKPLN